MIARFWVRPWVFPTLLAYLLFSFVSCSGSSPSTREWTKYDALPYLDTFRFDASRESITWAAIAAVQHRGGTITVSDPQTGFLAGEIATDRLLSEDAALPAGASSKTGSDGGAWAVVGLIVGLILFILFFGWLSDGCASGCTSAGSEPSDRSRTLCEGICT